VGGPGQGALTGSQAEMGREEHGVFTASTRAEESEMADPTSADNDATSPGNADETGGDPQHSSANDAEPGGADDKSPKKIK
jgi:hypothetical protein